MYDYIEDLSWTRSQLEIQISISRQEASRSVVTREKLTCTYILKAGYSDEVNKLSIRTDFLLTNVIL